MFTMAYDEFTMRKTGVYEWYIHFKEVLENVEDDVDISGHQ